MKKTLLQGQMLSIGATSLNHIFLLSPHDQGLYKEKVCTHCKQKPRSKGWHYYHSTFIILAHSRKKLIH
jgi:hypothetical protein